MRTCSLTLAAVTTIAACGDERDVDVYVVLPRIPDVCRLAGVAHVELAIEGPGPERFAIRSDSCEILQGDVAGFQTGADGPLQFPQLESGFFVVALTLTDADGTPRGGRRLPFDSRDGQVPVLLDRADLSGWPTTVAILSLPTCATDPALTSVHLALTPAQAFRPSAELDVPCGRPGSTTVALEVPRGPIAIVADGQRADGTACYHGALDGFFDDANTNADVPLTEVCP